MRRHWSNFKHYDDEQQMVFTKFEFKNVDENCGELDYIMNEGRSLDVNYIMTNNFAFGGINTSLILKRI